MKTQLFRPAVALLVLTTAFSGIYVFTWKYDPARLEARAMKGDAEAQYRLGKAYFDGLILAKNNYSAATWLAKAAAQRHAKAQAGLALMYVNGSGVRRDYAQAARLYRAAAEQGVALAQNQLGVLYARGKGVPRDLDEASKWFSLAAEQGCRTARQNLALTVAARPGTSFLLTANGKVYSSATVLKVDADGLTVAFEPEPGARGLARIRFCDLPANLQERYGWDHSGRARSETGLTLVGSLQPM